MTAPAATGEVFAAIDVGTNTVLLLVAERRGPGFVPIAERAEITRLGRGVDRTGVLDGAEYVAGKSQATVTDAEGRYRLETIMPGLYPGRTRHFHVKVQAPKQRVLTTQLYFPGEARNQRDGIFRPELLMAMSDSPTGKQARFNFVLDVD